MSKLLVRCIYKGFLGGSVVRDCLPMQETGSIPDLGRSHMLRSNYAREPQLLSVCSRAQEPQLLSVCSRAQEPQLLCPCASTPEALAP